MSEKPEENPEGLDFESLINGIVSDMSDLPNPEMLEAFTSLNELYKGFLAGGFSRKDSLELMAAYMYRVFGGDS